MRWGLADAARRNGVTLFENSRAVSIDTSNGVVVRTGAGNVRARFGVLACDALLDGLEPRIAGRIMPVANYLVATEPLSEPASLIADDLAVSDTLRRELFPAERRQAAHLRRRRALHAEPAGEHRCLRAPVHAQGISAAGAHARIAYAWGGLVSITMTRMPHIGRMGDLFFAHGYSGQGTILPAIAANAIAEAMTGKDDLFDVLAGLAPPEFPGGAELRAPLHVLGMLWYALRDRL
jgi:gamma-glutamylputrescine oxidase